MWSLDGSLRYLPLAALYDGEQYLVERFGLSVFTPASNARLKDRPSAEWKAAGFGVTKEQPGAPPLRDVAEELKGIISEQPGDGGVLAGQILLDEKFTKQSLQSALLNHYPIVHIASHFRFVPGNKMESFLLLGDGDHLTLSDVHRLPNLFSGVQLLALSACNTGLSGDGADGSEVEGLGVLAQLRGAKAVIASLWPVSDTSTSALMREFYRIRQASPELTKLEALRLAQIELLHGEVLIPLRVGPSRLLIHEAEVGTVRNTVAPTAPAFLRSPTAPYSHPFYWAPFFLMGNWL